MKNKKTIYVDTKGSKKKSSEKVIYAGVTPSYGLKKKPPKKGVYKNVV